MTQSESSPVRQWRTSRWRTDKVHVRRQPTRGRYDRATIDAVLDSSRVAHVAFVDDGQPYCMPLLYARVGDVVYVHGSSASRAMQALATGQPACLTVTRLDGLVLARSAFQHSANYASAILLGGFRALAEPAEKLLAFRMLMERLVPGRWSEVRPPSPRELRASAILAMAIDEASVKVRSGPPTDDRSRDSALDVWAGVVALVTSFGQPQPSPGLRDGVQPSASLLR